MNVDLTQYTQQARDGLLRSIELAKSFGNPYVEPEHLLAALLQDQNGLASRIYEGNSPLNYLMREYMPQLPGGHSNPQLGTQLADILERLSYPVSVVDLLCALENAAGGISKKKVLSIHKSLGIMEEDSFEEKRTATLDQFGHDLTQKAADGKLDPVIGRDAETLRVIHVLLRRTKNNPVLIGEAGVGKTAIVEGLAQRIVSERVPTSLKNKRIVQLDLAMLVAGTGIQGSLEERVIAILQEVQGGNVILFVDELHSITAAGGSGAMNAANLLKPALARGEIHLIGATTLDEYRNYIEEDAALERRLQPVFISEPSQSEAISILRGLKPYYAAHHGVEVSDEAIRTCVTLSARYITDRRLPDKAIDLLDEAASSLRVARESTPEGLYLAEQRLSVVEADLELLKDEHGNEEKMEKNDLRVEAASLKENVLSLRETWKREVEAIETLQQVDQEIEVIDKKKATPELRKQRSTLMRKRTRARKVFTLIPVSVNAESIADIVSRWTGIPLAKIDTDEQNRLADMEKHIHSRLVGQEDAVAAVCDAVRRAYAGMQDPWRPIGSFIFLGPTGVGKTELARTLAEFLFDDEAAMVRIDMSEYRERHTVARLFGAPPGYVGYEGGGQLTEAIRRRPYSVVLLDEIEKAHDDVHNTLLQVLEDGVMTDGHGRHVNFKHTIVIMTSNIAPQLWKPLKDSNGSWVYPKHDRRTINDALSKEFRPEFINRVDEIVTFHPLNEGHIRAIVDIQFNRISAMAEAKRITLAMNDDAKGYLAHLGFDPNYGARPLKRALQQHVQNPLAGMMMRGQVSAGDTVEITNSNDAINLVRR